MLTCFEHACSNSTYFSKIQLVWDGRTDDGRTDGRTHPLLAMRDRLENPSKNRISISPSLPHFSPQNNQYSGAGGRTLAGTSARFGSYVAAETRNEDQRGVARVLQHFRLYSLCSGGDLIILSKNVSAVPFTTLPQFQKLNPYGKSLGLSHSGSVTRSN